MKLKLGFCSIPAIIIAACSLATPSVGENTIVPSQERDSAQTLGVDGPSENKLIESVTVLGSVPLEDEFEDLKGRVLRTRKITILPGGQVAVHQHQSRPGVAYIIEGELIEYRNDQSTPVTRRAGEAAFEKTGVVHWWKNPTSRKAQVLVVDIVPKETK